MIYSIKKVPEYRDRAVEWFASKWGIPKSEYEKSIGDALKSLSPLPQWYIVPDSRGNIIGGCGLIENDFVDRTDLRPYLCALFVEPEARGQGIGGLLLLNARVEGAALGFEKLYLCTDHTSFYEKYGWKYIGQGKHPSGETSRIYEAETIKTPALEPMDTFFAKRLVGYDEHMIKDVDGCAEGYRILAANIPADAEKLLDLGCGTGLELDEIFMRKPDISVTGIDMTSEMLGELRRKHPDKKLELICGSYFDVSFGGNVFDCVISFQTMHHFSHEMKTRLYGSICKALKPYGVYIEGDYVAKSQFEEDFYYSEDSRLRKEQNIPEGEFFHFDTPCTVENQLKMLKAAGFTEVFQTFRKDNTAIIIAKR